MVASWTWSCNTLSAAQCQLLQCDNHGHHERLSVDQPMLTGIGMTGKQACCMRIQAAALALARYNLPGLCGSHTVLLPLVSTMVEKVSLPTQSSRGHRC